MNFKSWPKLPKEWAMENLYSAVRAALAKGTDCFKLFAFLWQYVPFLPGMMWGFKFMQCLEGIWKKRAKYYFRFTPTKSTALLRAPEMPVSPDTLYKIQSHLLTAARTQKLVQFQVTYCWLYDAWFTCLHILTELKTYKFVLNGIKKCFINAKSEKNYFCPTHLHPEHTCWQGILFLIFQQFLNQI